ncbi:family 31 glycosyltransferase [Rhypophila sp. PSN 637]
MAAPAPLLALHSPKPVGSQSRFTLLNRRIFGHHPRPSLLCWSLVSLVGAFSLLVSFRFLLGDNSRSRWTFLPFSKSQPPSPAEPRTDSFLPFDTTSSFHPVSYSESESQSKSISDLCANFPHHITQNRIQAVLKIGHGECQDKLDAQLNSVSACFQPGELLIFSDLDEDLKTKHPPSNRRPFNLPSSYFDPYPHNEGQTTQAEEFTNYEAMIALAKEGNLTTENDPTRKDNTGWKLDKYKFLAEVERAWEMRPNKEWYVFYETDTYVVWDNLFRFLLGGLDPNKEWYMGSPSPGRVDNDYADPEQNGRRTKIKTWFANGGPGFVLSRGAMEKLLRREMRRESEEGRLVMPPLTLKWLDTIRSDCCGDSVLGWALWKVGFKLSGMFPMFNVYPLHGVPFSERKWCQPVLTMHKTLPADMEGLWRWEQGVRRLGRPLLYADLYEFRHPGSIQGEVHKNWDNTNYDKQAKGGQDVGAKTLDECEKACQDDEKCLQYMWRGEDRHSCVLQVFINLGLEKQPERKEKNITFENPHKGEPAWRLEVEVTSFTSGWMTDRIEGWKSEHECTRVDWLWPSLDRYF